MSTDRLVLSVLERAAQVDLHYFELVELHYFEVSDLAKKTKTLTCFFCLGKHAVFLVSRDISGICPDDDAGEIPFEHIERLVEDKNSCSCLALQLAHTSHPFWARRQVVVRSEHRHRLVMYLRAAMSTDYVWRFGVIRDVPCAEGEMHSFHHVGGPSLQVEPFDDYQAIVQEGYRFFVRKSFTDKAASLHSLNAGKYVDKSRDMTLTVQIQEPVPLDSLRATDSDHIRWVAMRQRQLIINTIPSAATMSTGFYLKKMNLASDTASWTGWETSLRLDQEVMVNLFLRRQYLPPLAESCQDIFIILTVGTAVLDSSTSGVTQESLQAEAMLIADTISPLVQNCTVPQTMYTEMVQARLNALLFDADAMDYLQSRLGLRPEQRLVDEMRVFVMSLLRFLQDVNALDSHDLISSVATECDKVVEKDPMAVPVRMAQLWDFSPSGSAGESDEQAVQSGAEAKNAWHARVARYLAHCWDGGLLGSRLQLSTLTEPYVPNPQSKQRIQEVIMFMLHIRSKDMAKPFINKDLRLLFQDADLFHHSTFNDHVMQSLVELGWIEKVLDRLDTGGGRKGKISADYAQFLARVLSAPDASINLKAAVCRQFSAKDGSDHVAEVLRPLLQTMRHSSIYLKTNATLSLVNMASAREIVKEEIIQLGFIEDLSRNMKCKDPMLAKCTLALLRLLSQLYNVHPLLVRAGILEDVLYALWKTPCVPTMEDLLAEAASVTGQMCAHESIWRSMCEHVSKPVERLVDIYKQATPCGRCRAKAMFALRMFVDRSSVHPKAKRETVAEVIDDVADDMQAMTDSQVLDLDNAANAILLLCTLFKSQAICKEAMMKRVDLAEIMSEHFNFSELGRLETTGHRLEWLITRLAGAAAEEAAH